jgi:3-phosphoshikimate 1-carboxyvinyltransferase
MMEHSAHSDGRVYEPAAPERIPTLDALVLPPHAVVIADRRLPQRMLTRLDHPVLVEAGEKLKTLAGIEELAGQVLQRRSTRPLTLVAVGGGSVGDAVGFLASILWRGVGLWQVPTTMVAMVDSAHGGKTAVNLGSAKNQLGTFYPAGRVILVDEFLDTLPTPLRRSGMVELLKALWLGDAASVHALTGEEIETLTFAPFAEVGDRLGRMIEHAVGIKQRIVAQDPFEDTGVRTVLNLGHTLAHALELTTGISHGAAVAWGMAATLDLSLAHGLPSEVSAHCRETLFPLLVPPPSLPSDEVLQTAILRDKKRSDDVLRSVLLRGLGDAVVTAEPTAADWIAALRRGTDWFARVRVRVRMGAPRSVPLRIEASKSELNRALVIAAQRIGRTVINGHSNADDVRCTLRALRGLGYPVEETERGYVVDNLNRDLSAAPDAGERTIFVCEGGTTFRFLLALCCTNVKPTKLLLSPALMQRPHDALLRSLRSAGASIEAFSDLSGQGFVVRGWKQMPQVFSIDPTASSQFVSALALLAVGAEYPFTIRLLGEPVSRSYLDLTFAMLEQAGVEVIAHGDLIALNQTERLNEKLTLEIESDESSRAVWNVAHYLGHPVEAGQKARVPRQPDGAVEHYLAALREARRGPQTIDLSQVPDLLPVLSIAALTAPHAVTFTGAAHLRSKESNRIDDFAQSLREAGADVHPRPDGLELRPSGELHPEVIFNTHGDHRLVMAGTLLTLVSHGSVVLDTPWTVSKSYPRFWDDARRAGWSVRAAD